MSEVIFTTTSVAFFILLAHSINQLSEKLLTELKIKIKNLKLNKKIRINKSGCLDRCELGPVMVIYPEGIWYSYKNLDDINEILESHLINNKVVERLKI